MTSPIRLLPMQLIHNFNLTTNINFSLTQHIMSFLAMHFTQRVTYVLILLSTVSIFQVVLSLMSHLLFSFCSKIPLLLRKQLPGLLAFPTSYPHYFSIPAFYPHFLVQLLPLLPLPINLQLSVHLVFFFFLPLISSLN